MVKSYFRYEEASSFGVISSGESNIVYDNSGRYVIAAALEKIHVWHTRQGVPSKTLSPNTSSSSSSSTGIVTSIASSPSSLIASGYTDGSIRIWDIEKGTCETTLNGHKSAVSAMRYNKLGSLIASGSKDTDIILWDVVGEAGLFRLRGHRDQVTDLVFLDSGKKLVSSSKDKFLRVWDLETQHCVQIVSGHHSEIWSIDADLEERYLVAGSADPELRFYTIKHDSADVHSNISNNQADVNKKDTSEGNKWDVLKFFGEIQRQTKHRVATVKFNKSGNLLACQEVGKMVEMFSVLDENESKRKAKRRISRRKEKKASKMDAQTTENGSINTATEEDGKIFEITVSDVFKILQTLRANQKVSSLSFSPVVSKNSLATVALSLTTNLLEFYSIESSSATKLSAIELQGNRSVVRSVSLSSDNTLLLSTNHNAIKIWNPSTGSCLRTVDSDFGLCSLFVPGNKYAIVGTKTGKLELVDVRSGTCIEVVKAHGNEIQSVVLTPDGNGFITGGADNDVKFWEFGSVKKSSQDVKHFTVSPVDSMTMNDAVLAIAISPNGKHIAVALADGTVKVYYMDSHKFFLSLYGHKLPVSCLDISTDGDLLVSGSHDKNLKIWGLDFGDCHKSIFAHAASVLAVKFVRNTHYVFSVGNDRLVKYWDADKFELLLTLDGHHDKVCCLAISNRGDFLVTGSFDRSIRRWDRTEEPFFIEEEKEKRMEEMFESDIENLFEDKSMPKEEIPEEGAVGLAGKTTQETLSGTDSIIEALDMADAEIKRLAEHEEEKLKGKPAHFRPNILMLGLSPSDFVLRAISNVRTNDLELTLLALPFSDALKLLSHLKDWATIPDKVELVGRVATLLLQLHHNQLVSTVAAKPVLTSLKDIIPARVKECKDTLGFNLAAMDHLKQLMALRSDAPFRDAKSKLLEIRSQIAQRAVEAGQDIKHKKRKKKQKKVDGTHVWS